MPTAKSSPATASPINAPTFSDLDWLVHGFSTRQGGVTKAYAGDALNLGFTKADTRANVEQNRMKFQRSLGVADWPLVTLRQVHSDIIHPVDDAGGNPLTGDGLVSDRPELLLAVQTADCLPVIVADRKKHAVGIFHAGWRGSAARIVQKGVGAMRAHFDSRPRDLIAALGPGIHACCYQVGEPVREQFSSQFAYAAELFQETRESDPVRERYPLLFLTARAPGHSELPNRLTLDLVEANRRQLVDAGVPEKAIWASELCTSCRKDLLFSHRAEHGSTGRMMAVVGVRSEV